MFEKFKTRANSLKSWIAKKFKDNPLEFSAAAVALVAAIGNALNAWTKYQNSRSWRREVKRRENLNQS